MEKKFVNEAVYVPNPQIIQINTNWDRTLHEALKIILENIEGVENVAKYSTLKYQFSIEIGVLFDRDKMRDIILAKIEEYFNS